MLSTLGHLALRSWGAMMAAMNTGTVGFLLSVVGISLCIWLAGLGFESWAVKSLRAAFAKSKKFLWADLAGVVLFLIVVYPAFCVRTVYYRHTGLQYELAQNRATIKGLRVEIEYRKNNLAPTDPVFFNIRDMLDAFAVYRNLIKGEPCSITTTAPAETQRLATMFGTMANVTSGCSTYNAPATSGDPIIDRRVTDGMVDDAIVVHATHDEDKPVNALMTILAGRIKMIRRYDTAPSTYTPPPGGFKHLIWFQFGNKVKWQSENRWTVIR